MTYLMHHVTCLNNNIDGLMSCHVMSCNKLTTNQTLFLSFLLNLILVFSSKRKQYGPQAPCQHVPNVSEKFQLCIL